MRRGDHEDNDTKHVADRATAALGQRHFRGKIHCQFRFFHFLQASASVSQSIRKSTARRFRK